MFKITTKNTLIETKHVFEYDHINDIVLQEVYNDNNENISSRKLGLKSFFNQIAILIYDQELE